MNEVTVDKKNPPPVVLLTVEQLKKCNENVRVIQGEKTFVKSNDESIDGENAVSRHLARLYPKAGLYGNTALESSQIDSWLDFSTLYLKNSQDINIALAELNKSLAPATYLVGHNFTLADFAVWSALVGNTKWSNLLDGGKADTHVSRWFKYCSDQGIFKAVSGKIAPKKESKKTSENDGKKVMKTTLEDGGKFFELPGAEQGKVVTRFPPEASGYLHIGHAKAALLNQYYKDLYGGKLIMRFDDTNPAKENAHYEKIILEDLQMLQLTPDFYTRTSDHFDKLFEYAEKLIKQGDAFCDNTPSEEMRAQREQKQPSGKRDQPVEETLRLFDEMKRGTPTGFANCLRAKIDHASNNGALRDPVIYRCRDEEHIAQGNKFKAYPTYDFACPIVDSVEGVTHALRTSEYMDRDAQYYWIVDKLGIRKPRIHAYSRLNLVNTVLSKRKLTYLVDEGHVEGWDDPRFPTVRGVLRRGLTIEGLKEFILAQGFSKSNVTMGWDKIWSFNKKIIDPTAPRYTALLKEKVVPVNVKGVLETSAQYPLHPKSDIGEKNVYYSDRVFVEGEDAQLMKEGELVTFINWGNLRVSKIHRDGEQVTAIDATAELENKDFKKTTKVTWLSQHNEAPFIPTTCSFFDNIITKDILDKDDDFKNFIAKNSKTEYTMYGDPELKNVRKGDIIQLQRRGYFICDRAYEPPSRHSGREVPCMLFHVPDGSDAGMMNKSKKDKDIGKNPGGGSSKNKEKASKKQQSKQTTSPQKESKASLSTSATTAATTTTASVSHTPEQQEIYDSIIKQGDKIRELKSSKAAKEAVLSEVQILKELKEKYKTSTGCDYAPPGGNATSNSKDKKSKGQENKMAPTPVSAAANASPKVEAVVKRITDQGDKIRKLKGEKAAKEALQPEIDALLKLKGEYKTLTGTDYQAPGTGSSKRDKKEGKKENKAPKEQKQQQPKQDKKAPKQQETSAAAGKEDEKKKQTRLGMEVKKEESLSDWYSQVITKSEMIEYYDVSGCYILRPWAYGIWERIKEYFDPKIKGLGVENCYFPMFVSQAALEKEKEHIADFAPEVAWVTKSGQSDLAEPIAVRPTSETIMYPAYAKWIQSHRDLPLRLNQWCNVVRWEFKHPQPFLRTREFLWQEGHTAFATREQACEEVYQILDFYASVYTDLLAIPVVKGRKTEKEKFAGGDFTTTVEAYIHASGRAIQGATSHHLGQNFSKMFNIQIEDPNKPESKEKLYVHQNSWGLTTRTIGVLVMVHGDNKGLVLPPRVANIQVVIVPVGMSASTSDEKKKEIMDKCAEYDRILSNSGVRTNLDTRENYTAGWKFNHWEMKGVPVRLELGPRDLEKSECLVVRRDTGEKITLKQAECVDKVRQLLDTIQSNMLARACKQLDENLTVTQSWEDFKSMLDDKKIIQAPFCGEIPCEEKIKKESAREETEAGAPSMGAKSLCIPFTQPEEVTATTKCIHPDCGKPAKFYTLFGRSY